VALALA